MWQPPALVGPVAIVSLVYSHKSPSTQYGVLLSQREGLSESCLRAPSETPQIRISVSYLGQNKIAPSHLPTWEMGAGRQADRQAGPGIPALCIGWEMHMCPGNPVLDRHCLSLLRRLDCFHTVEPHSDTVSPCCFTGSGGEWIPVIFPLTTQQVTNALLSRLVGWSLATAGREGRVAAS